MKTPSILTVNNLTTSFQFKNNTIKVVDDLSFSLYKGKTLAIVGESGSGKSMTAFSIMRILPTPPALPSTGEVIYKDKNLLTISESEMQKLRGSRIAMIFQDPMSALNPVYTVGYQLLEVVDSHLNLFGEEAEAYVIQALDDVGIVNPKQRIHDYPHQMSGGMKQRVMIAMALLAKPDILIADEPTTALDVTIQAQILDLIRDLQKKYGMALLLITHDMGVVAEMADEVIVMYATENIESADVHTLFDHISHPYTQGLFASLPSETIERGKLPAIEKTVPPIHSLPSGCKFHPRCPHVMDICKKEKPPLIKLDHNSHYTKCWLYDSQIQEKETGKGTGTLN